MATGVKVGLEFTTGDGKRYRVTVAPPGMPFLARQVKDGKPWGRPRKFFRLP